MVDGRRGEAWNHTAQLLAMVYNAHRAPNARLMKPAEFHPLSKPARQCLVKTKDLSPLKAVFVKE